ncbi:MAG: transporter [Planctomycetota bacterium]|nr:transporter [Planctomycetota bacterium]
MPHILVPLLATVALSVLSVFADYLLKRASGLPSPFRSAQFLAAALIYAGSSFGWVYVLRHFKLATVGAVYSIVIVVLLALIGVTVFRESLTAAEATGLVFAVAALFLLGRFLAP